MDCIVSHALTARENRYVKPIINSGVKHIKITEGRHPVVEKLLKGEEEFEQSLALARRVGFSRMHVFGYSPRKGTAAAELPDPVSHKEKTQWFAELTAAQEEIAAKRIAESVGKTYTVLVEGRSKTDASRLAGRTDGNVMIEFAGSPEQIGTYCDVRVTETGKWTIFGKAVPENESK